MVMTGPQQREWISSRWSAHWKTAKMVNFTYVWPQFKNLWVTFDSYIHSLIRWANLRRDFERVGDEIQKSMNVDVTLLTPSWLPGSRDISLPSDASDTSSDHHQHRSLSPALLYHFRQSDLWPRASRLTSPPSDRLHVRGVGNRWERRFEI